MSLLSFIANRKAQQQASEEPEPKFGFDCAPAHLTAGTITTSKPVGYIAPTPAEERESFKDARNRAKVIAAKRSLGS
jgi:hypothetical protein